MATTKIKVPRLKLLERAREVAAEDAKAFADSQKGLGTVKENEQKLRDALIVKLEERLKKAKTDPAPVPRGSWSASLQISAEITQGNPLFDNLVGKPAVRDMSEVHAKAIRMLEMSVDEVLVIATDDLLARYI